MDRARVDGFERDDGRALPSRRSGDSDGGFTLVELVCAVAIMAIVIAPILGSVIASIGASSSARNLAQVETVLQNAADRVNRAPKACAYLIYAQAAVQAEGWAADRAKVEEMHYVPNSDATKAGQWVANACDGTAPSELIVQLVRITVTSPNGQVKKTTEVVKSDV